MRGRKPKPTSLHKLQGTINVTRHAARTREPVAEGDLYAPPDWLTESQQANWRHVIEHAPAGILRRIDQGILAVWVEAEDRHRMALIQQARLDVGNAMPLLTKGKDGLPRPSPYIGIITKAALIMLKAASELGFSPAARPRLAGAGFVPPPAADDPWARLKLLQGGKS